MAYVRFGNMWEHEAEAKRIFVTTNASLNAHGELVMGRGAALEAKNKIPGLAQRLGQKLTVFQETFGDDSAYGILLDDESHIGAFQVKNHWAHLAELELIEFSTDLLCIYANLYPDEQIFLNFPGIGYGGLNIDDVIDILSKLPENVILWTHYKAQKLRAEKRLSTPRTR